MADTLLIPARMQSAGFFSEDDPGRRGLHGHGYACGPVSGYYHGGVVDQPHSCHHRGWTLGSQRLIAYRSKEALRFAFLFRPACGSGPGSSG